jgi:hypothetical protein
MTRLRARLLVVAALLAARAPEAAAQATEDGYSRR